MENVAIMILASSSTTSEGNFSDRNQLDNLSKWIFQKVNIDDRELYDKVHTLEISVLWI